MRVNMFYLLWITVLLFASPVRGEVSPKKTKVSTIRPKVNSGSKKYDSPNLVNSPVNCVKAVSGDCRTFAA